MSALSARPLYLQVRDVLAERIASREWTPSSAVPNEMILAREMGVSPGTMRKALELLENEGLVTRRQGRGTFVNDPASPARSARYNHLYGADGQRIAGEIRTLEIVEDFANDAECVRLCVAKKDLVCRIKRVRLHAGRAYLNEEASLPATLFPGLAKTGLCARGIVEIAHAYGVLLGEAVERVRLGSASRSAAEALNVAESSAVVVLDRIINARGGRPAEWRRAECRMSEMHYKVETS